MIQERAPVTTEREWEKPYSSFQIVPVSMILSDLEWLGEIFNGLACINSEWKFPTLGATGSPVSRSKGQRSRSPDPLMLTHIVRHIFRTARPTNFKLGTSRGLSATAELLLFHKYIAFWQFCMKFVTPYMRITIRRKSIIWQLTLTSILAVTGVSDAWRQVSRSLLTSCVIMSINQPRMQPPDNALYYSL